MSSNPAQASPVVLFTAFEPSGDAHAAPVIAELRRRAPHVRVFALGGTRMADAGAQLIETTTENPAMGLAALGKIWSTRALIKRVEQWAEQNRPALQVAVDSPAANFPVCKAMKRTGARCVHLVAPQFWAWAPWRIGKLRAVSSMVLCLLQFEQDYFESRGVAARFIGHPRINRSLDEAELDAIADGFPQQHPRIAILPGSRRQEIDANLALMMRVYERLAESSGAACAVIVAANDDLAAMIRSYAGELPGGMQLVVGQADAAIRWSDLCLAVSGTVSLDVARQRKPMVGVYKVSMLARLIARFLLVTPHRLLPNIVAQRRIVPEFVPTIAGPQTIAHAAAALLTDRSAYDRCVNDLENMVAQFDGHDPGVEAATHILNLLEQKAGINAQSIEPHTSGHSASVQQP